MMAKSKRPPCAAPEGWEWAQFDIQVAGCGGKPTTMRWWGFVNRPFGIDQRRAGWHVTHLPTGLLLSQLTGHPANLATAIAVCELLRREASGLEMIRPSDDTAFLAQIGDRLRNAVTAAFPDVSPLCGVNDLAVDMVPVDMALNGYLSHGEA